MPETALMLPALLLGFVAFVWFWLRYPLSWRRPPKSAPPGKLGWPLIGETPEFIKTMQSGINPDAFVEKRRALYGDIFSTHVLGNATVISLDPEVNKFILQNEGKLFISSYPKSLAKLFGRWAIIGVRGDLHKKLHSCISSFINSTKLKGQVIADVESIMNTVISGWRGRTVFVQDEARKLAFIITMKILVNFYQPGQETEDLMKEFRLFIKGLVSIPFRIPGTTFARATKAKERIRGVIQKIIDDRRQKADDECRDVLFALMNEKQSSGQSFSDEMILDNIMDFLANGAETITMIMTLAIKFLNDNPCALEEVKREHMAIANNKQAGEALTWSDYVAMRFTQNVINETLRITNVAAAVTREAYEDVEIKGYVIPKGWTVLPYFRTSHFDKSVYSDPFRFDPWRWQNKIPSLFFTPFGGGPRICAGMELARLEIAVFIYLIVTQFTWEAEEDEINCNFPQVSLKRGLPIRVYDIAKSSSPK
eukprot:c26842_g1_i1 orf=204-1646(+)